LGGPGGKLCDVEHPNGAWALSGLVNGIGIVDQLVERSPSRSWPVSWQWMPCSASSAIAS
jgi:hypothetical protein